MSRHQVVRRGTGQLHIAEPEHGYYRALCGSKVEPAPGVKVHTWKAGRQGATIWAEWPKRCARCEARDRELRHR